jgi:hypothetical protein
MLTGVFLFDRRKKRDSARGKCDVYGNPIFHIFIIPKMYCMGIFYKLMVVKITIAIFYFSVSVQAQNFAPFNKDVTKRFYNTLKPTDNDYFFYADSAFTPLAGVSVFHQYFTLRQPSSAVNTSSCGFWGGGGHRVIDTTWLGATVGYNSNTMHLTLNNSHGETLDFNLSISTGDSAIFYQNSTDKYYILAGSVQQETVLTTTDAVKTFTILHYNAAGKQVNSVLHNSHFKLGMKTGLINFMAVYDFPAVETHLTLQGQLNPLVGIYQMRLEDLYPFHTGDSMQYSGSVIQHVLQYRKSYRVVNRTETSDSVFISFSNSLNYLNLPGYPSNSNTILDIYPSILRFAKNSDILCYPYNKLYPNEKIIGRFGYNSKIVGSIDIPCVGERSYYQVTHEPYWYCKKNCHCLGSFDAFEQIFPSRTFAVGIGVNSASAFFASGSYWQSYLSLQYFSIGDVTCGNYVSIGISENDLISTVLYPNPVDNEVKISEAVDNLVIYSLEGRILRNIKSPPLTISVSELNRGLYFFELRKGKSTKFFKVTKL